ncbi:MAG TPA: long-chain fatty acid--CoA ligase [Bacillota bacterium]
MTKKWLPFYETGLQAQLEYPSLTLGQVLGETATKYPKHSAMIYQGRRWNYTELNELVNQMCHLLMGLGVTKGDRIGIQLPNCPQFVIACYAACRCGAIGVTINPHFTKDDLAYIIRDSGLTTLVTCNDLLPVLAKVDLTGIKIITTDTRTPFDASQDYQAPPQVIRLERELFQQPKEDPVIPVCPDDSAFLQYTGGTTGIYKGAILSHRNLVTNSAQVRHFFKNVYEDGAGRFLCVIPLFHIYGMTTSMHMPILTGSEMQLLPRFDINELMITIDHYKPNIFMGVPAMYGAIALREGNNRYDLHSIKACVSGSAPLPQTIAEKFEAITDGKLREGYGLSETSPVVAINPIYGQAKIGSVGVPLPDTEIRIVDPVTGQDLTDTGEVGEIIVKGPQVMQGYWNRPEETAAVLRDGWLHTGDLGWMDADGYTYITDRLKDMIITAGEKVYPREIEELLYTHPAVKEVAVIGVPHPLRGEVPQAFVSLKETAAASEKELKQFCSKHLSKFKVPQKIELVDALPRSTVGKVLRRLLQEKVRQGSAVPLSEKVSSTGALSGSNS